MIELDLEQVLDLVRHHERVMAAVRKIVVEQAYDTEWIEHAMTRAAKIRQALGIAVQMKGSKRERSLRIVGNVLVIRPEG
ncbi:hypothetical protein ES703_107898 [subsurface metagenome]